MPPIFSEDNEAIQDLPPELQKALRRYAESKSDQDLDSLISGVLKDLGAQVTSEENFEKTHFINDLGLDSLAIAEFVFFFEDVFKVKITNEELSSLMTLGELKFFLNRKLG